MNIKVHPFIRKLSQISQRSTSSSESDDEYLSDIPSEIIVPVKAARKKHSRRSSHSSRRRNVVGDLWRTAPDLGSHVDDLCFDRVVKMMSINDTARKVLLDDMLNRGEF